MTRTGDIGAWGFASRYSRRSGAGVPQKIASFGFILLLFAYTGSMFQAPAPGRGLVIRYKRCGQNIPAPVEAVPAQPIAAKCPLCEEYRRHLPSEVFQG